MSRSIPFERRCQPHRDTCTVSYSRNQNINGNQCTEGFVKSDFLRFLNAENSEPCKEKINIGKKI